MLLNNSHFHSNRWEFEESEEDQYPIPTSRGFLFCYKPAKEQLKPQMLQGALDGMIVKLLILL